MRWATLGLAQEARAIHRVLLLSLPACALYIGLVLLATGAAPPPRPLLLVCSLGPICATAPFIATWAMAWLARWAIGPGASLVIRWYGFLISSALLWFAGINLDLSAGPFVANTVLTIPFSIAAGIVLTCGVSTAVYRLVARREPPADVDTRVCPKCLYDLSGIERAGRCPECGREFVST